MYVPVWGHARPSGARLVGAAKGSVSRLGAKSKLSPFTRYIIKIKINLFFKEDHYEMQLGLIVNAKNTSRKYLFSDYVTRIK